MIKKVIFFVLLFSCSSAFSVPRWYLGTINRVWPNEQTGGFIVTLSPPSILADCKHSYAYFQSSKLQPGLLNNSLTVALSAFHAGGTVGIVIDKDQNDGYCHATGIDLRK